MSIPNFYCVLTITPPTLSKLPGSQASCFCLFAAPFRIIGKNKPVVAVLSGDLIKDDAAKVSLRVAQQ